MSLLDDARRLAAESPSYQTDDGDGVGDGPFCTFCDSYPSHHDPDCPWLSMPRIVAALEAADAVVKNALGQNSYDGFLLLVHREYIENLDTAMSEVVPKKSEDQVLTMGPL